MKLHTLGTGGPRLDGERGSACHVLEAAGRAFMFEDRKSTRLNSSHRT